MEGKDDYTFETTQGIVKFSLSISEAVGYWPGGLTYGHMAQFLQSVYDWSTRLLGTELVGIIHHYDHDLDTVGFVRTQCSEPHGVSAANRIVGLSWANATESGTTAIERPSVLHEPAATEAFSVS